MKIEIGDKNKIKKSIIGKDNTIINEESKGSKIIIEVAIGLFVTIIGGIILYLITK